MAKPLQWSKYHPHCWVCSICGHPLNFLQKKYYRQLHTCTFASK